MIYGILGFTAFFFIGLMFLTLWSFCRFSAAHCHPLTLMSLKAFHLVFITAATALAFGCGGLGAEDFFSPEGRPSDLVFGLGSLATGAGLDPLRALFSKETQKRGLPMSQAAFFASPRSRCRSSRPMPSWRAPPVTAKATRRWRTA